MLQEMYKVPQIYKNTFLNLVMLPYLHPLHVSQQVTGVVWFQDLRFSPVLTSILDLHCMVIINRYALNFIFKSMKFTNLDGRLIVTLRFIFELGVAFSAAESGSLSALSSSLVSFAPISFIRFCNPPSLNILKFLNVL